MYLWMFDFLVLGVGGGGGEKKRRWTFKNYVFLNKITRAEAKKYAFVRGGGGTAAAHSCPYSEFFALLAPDLLVLSDTISNQLFSSIF